MKKTVVGAIRTSPASVLEDIEHLLEIAGLKDAFDPDSRTIIKDNISWHHHYPSANTTPWQLEGAIRGLRANGFSDLLAVHNETVVTRSEFGERQNRLDRVYQSYDVPEIYNFRKSDVSWDIYKPRGNTPALNRVYPDGFSIPRQFIGTNIIHLPTIKCHIYTTTTGAMKNAFGGLLNNRRHYTHSHIHRTLVDLLIVQKEIHSGLFALMDGTYAGNGPGPRTMFPVEKNVLLASSDQVAIDAVAAKLMGFDPLKIGYIKMAHDEGLGIGDPREIEVVGADIGGESWDFSVGNNFVSLVGGSIWFGPFKALQKLLFHTPLVYGFVLASFLYHDYIWYPVFGRKWIREFNRSKWGELFRERYGTHGSLQSNNPSGQL